MPKGSKGASAPPPKGAETKNFQSGLYQGPFIHFPCFTSGETEALAREAFQSPTDLGLELSRGVAAPFTLSFVDTREWTLETAGGWGG